MTIHGSVIDPAYSRMLIQKTDLSLQDIFALDRVQKKLPIDEVMAKRLRREMLIEGRKPNFHVSASVASATATKADYIRTRPQSDEFYAKLVTDYLEKFGSATRSELDKLLLPKLSEVLTPEQKMTKVSTLLTKMRRNGLIINAGSDKASSWKFAEEKK